VALNLNLPFNPYTTIIYNVLHKIMKADISKFKEMARSFLIRF
jgi:hypothetical protein